MNDTQTTLFNGDSDWDWVEPRSPRSSQSDWYLFAHGHDYRGAMKDYTKVAGGIPLPPRSTFGIFFSRYWGKHSIIDCYAVIYILWQLTAMWILRTWSESTKLTTFLSTCSSWTWTGISLFTRKPDKERKVSESCYNLKWWRFEYFYCADQANQTIGWTGYTFDPHLFPNPSAFLSWLNEKGIHATMNLHPASGVQPWEEFYPEMVSYSFVCFSLLTLDRPTLWALILALKITCHFTLRTSILLRIWWTSCWNRSRRWALDSGGSVSYSIIAQPPPSPL